MKNELSEEDSNKLITPKTFIKLSKESKEEEQQIKSQIKNNKKSAIIYNTTDSPVRGKSCTLVCFIEILIFAIIFSLCFHKYKKDYKSKILLKNNNILSSNNLTYDLVIVVHKNRVSQIKYEFLKNVNYNNLYLITDISAFNKTKEISKKYNITINFLDENKIYPNLTYKAIDNFIKKVNKKYTRAGWYLQQFLKLSYAFISKSEYYLILDSDTIILKNMSYFSDNGKPFFIKRTEYHKPYFEITQKLLGFGKTARFSFVAESMLFKADIVKEMINKIENAKNVKGHYFFEKILNSIRRKHIPKSGFSEFETYGTYVYINYPNLYEYKDLKNFRKPAPEKLNFEFTNEIMEYFSKSYYILTIERTSNNLNLFYLLIKNKSIREKYSAEYVFNNRNKLYNKYKNILEH